MFAALKKFVAELSEHDKPTSHFAENDYRLAAAALLVHAATIDGLMSDVEKDTLRSLLRQRFDLAEGTADELFTEATEAEREAIDLYHFTSLINRTLDEPGRLRMVEMMWEIAYADGNITEFEDNLIWRVADLLGVSSQERIALRQRVGARAEPGESR